jgi:hypothetical protein
MRKLTFLFLALLAGTFVMTSCSKDDDTFGPPTLNFIGGEGYVDEDATLPVGIFFKVGIAASANVESGEKLTSLRVTRTMNNITFADSTYDVNEDTFNADFTLNAQQAGDSETITFVLTDKANQTATKSLLLTYEAAGETVAKTTDVMMGSFNDDYGSFYSTVNKVTYSIAEAGTHQADVDFLFYQGAQNGTTIASPADAQANDVYAMGSWTIKNATMFATTSLTAEQFDAIGTTYTFPAFEGTDSSITGMEVGQVIMFETVGNKLGLIKINQVGSRGDYASIDVIVAQ